MKKYLLFVLSFILLFGVINVFSGMLQTVFYQPDFSNLWNNVEQLHNEVIFVKSSSTPTIIVTLISATIAFYLQSRLSKKSVLTK
ncbi:hypothetical protein [Bacillus sp. AFS017336]|uniref:hypothetical protein n=1 Tax=Bacillus sp. AFS017336 TaxID=2033489 RepID=UPI000BF03880|nr:hypothetical protein [Bacillus sp. AFS017336]PEK98333.1 hypothetical protein CN601_25840 [Bacillus sp. AFS017336]